MSLIDVENNDRAVLEAEDAAIYAAEHHPTLVDGDTIYAVAGTPLADLIEALNDDPPPLHPQAEAVGGIGG